MKKLIALVASLIIIMCSCSVNKTSKNYQDYNNDRYFSMYRAVHDMNILNELSSYYEDLELDNPIYDLDEFSIFKIQELKKRLNMSESEARKQYDNALLVWLNSSEKKYNGEKNPVKLFKESIIDNISNNKVQEIFNYYGVSQNDQSTAWEFYTKLYLAYDDITYAYVTNSNYEYPRLDNIDVENDRAYSEYCKKQIEYWSNYDEFERQYIDELKKK